MSLFTLVAALIFLTFGITVLVYFVRNILSAIPLFRNIIQGISFNPFKTVSLILKSKKLKNIQEAISLLEAAQDKNNLVAIEQNLVQVLKLEYLGSLQAIALSSELYLTVLDSGVYLLEQKGVRFSQLPKFEQLIQNHQNLLGKLQEVIQIKGRLLRRSKEKEKPKRWAIDEIDSQYQTIRTQLIQSRKEIEQIVLLLLSVSKNTSDQATTNYH